MRWENNGECDKKTITSAIKNLINSEYNVLNKNILSFSTEFIIENDRWELRDSARSSKALKSIDRSAK